MGFLGCGLGKGRVKYTHYFFQKYIVNFTFSLLFTECSITGSIFIRRLSFFGGKSIREYFMGKSGAFHSFFSMLAHLKL